jgi:hypothetical protein
LDCQNPGNTHGDTAILANTIMDAFRKFWTTSQYTWLSPKSVSIGTLITETRSECIGLVFIEIRLSVLSSPQQHCNKTIIINLNREAIGQSGTNKLIIRLDSKEAEDNFTIFKRQNPTSHRKVIIILVSHIIVLVVWFCHHNTKRCSNAPTAFNDRKYSSWSVSINA